MARNENDQIPPFFILFSFNEYNSFRFFFLPHLFIIYFSNYYITNIPIIYFLIIRENEKVRGKRIKNATA